MLMKSCASIDRLKARSTLPVSEGHLSSHISYISLCCKQFDGYGKGDVNHSSLCRPQLLGIRRITLANGQLDAKIFNTFITILYMYMFRTIFYLSSSGQIVLIQHLVSSPLENDRPVHRCMYM
jgi:hypothetical protein